MKKTLEIITASLALTALLLYTFAHTGHLLAVYVRPPIVGYVAAAGIELSIVSLALRLGEIKKAKGNTAFVLFTLVSVVTVSAIANIAAGFEIQTGASLTRQSIRQIDPIQAIVGLAATGLVPLVVLALSEIIGSDVQVVAKLQAKAERQQATTDQPQPEKQETKPDTNQQRQDIDQRLDQILDLLAQQPGLTYDQIAKVTKTSPKTAQRDIARLVKQKRVLRNGQGLEIKQ